MIGIQYIKIGCLNFGTAYFIYSLVVCDYTTACSFFTVEATGVKVAC
jgi:hypothetical protein